MTQSSNQNLAEGVSSRDRFRRHIVRLDSRTRCLIAARIATYEMDLRREAGGRIDGADSVLVGVMNKGVAS